MAFNIMNTSNSSTEMIPNYLKNKKNEMKKKYKICNENGLNLIIIPHTYSYKNKQMLQEFIFNKLWEIC